MIGGREHREHDPSSELLWLSNEEHALALARFHVWRRRVGLIPLVVAEGEERPDDQHEDHPEEDRADGKGRAHVKRITSATTQKAAVAYADHLPTASSLGRQNEGAGSGGSRKP